MRYRTAAALAAGLLVLGSAGTTVLAAPAEAAGTHYTWAGSSVDPHADNTSWTDARNWVPSGVPGDGDSVSIAAPDTEHCVARVTAVPAVTLADLSIAQDPQLCGVSVTGGPFTVTGTFSWNGGDLNAATTLQGTGTISGTNGRRNWLDQNLEVQGAVRLTGLTTDSSLRVRAATGAQPAARIHIAPGATLSSSGPNLVDYTTCCSDPARIVDDGTLAVTSGTLTVSGVEVDQQHYLTVGPGARLVSDGAPTTAADGATYSGSGRWLITDLAVARLTGTQHLAAGFHLELGGLHSPTGASLGGRFTLAGAGEFDWTGGTVEAALTIGHGVRFVVHGAHTDNGRRALWGRDYTNKAGDVAVALVNHGVISLEAGAAVDTLYRAALVNAGDGLLRLQGGTTIASDRCCTDPDGVVNSGGRVLVAGGSTTAVLRDLAYRTTDGTTEIAGGKTLQLDGGAAGQLTGGTVEGGGRLLLTGPTGIAKTVTVARHTTVALAAPGSLDGTATLAGRGAFVWSGGSVSGHSLTVRTSGGIRVLGRPVKHVTTIGGGRRASTIVFAAPTTFAAGDAQHSNLTDLGSSTLTTAGRTVFANHSGVRGAHLVNTGTLTVAPGRTGRVDLSAITNRGRAGVTAGTWQLSGGYQGAGRLSFTIGRAGHGILVVKHSASLAGPIVATNAGNQAPRRGARIAVVTAGTVHRAARACTITAGAGRNGGHWAAARTAHRLSLIWQRGRHTSC